ncbi:MAG TPA: PAC2 family protein [Microbacteriaceae bacterium]|nr:PAC2 family protein [Microbacteriaceae bacterium]
MRDPEELYEVLADLSVVPRGLDLVAGLTGFADAGHAVAQLSDHLVEALPGQELVRFVNDELLDYRSRRPIMTFESDHLSDYAPAELTLDLLEDELGTPFLLLSGYEPDLQWERFATAVLGLVDRLGVAGTTWVHAVPMPVPHTRPIGVTISGNREDLIEQLSIWRPTTQLPSTALHLIEYRLHQLGYPVSGLALLVPHYLGDTTYPNAAVAALEAITTATGLVFPTDELRADGREYLAKIEEQVGTNAELQRLIEGLERRHDSYMEENPLPSLLTDSSGNLPTADQIADELQKFLARQRDEGSEPS